MLPEDWSQSNHDYVFKPINPSYWNISAAVYAYVFAGLTRLGIDLAGESMIPAQPGFFPSIAMLDWETGQPNVRWHVLKLIRDHCGPGDKLVDTPGGSAYVLIQGFITRNGERKLLLVNKRDREFLFSLPEAAGGRIEAVDRTTGANAPTSRKIDGPTFKLGAFGIGVVTLVK